MQLEPILLELCILEPSEARLGHSHSFPGSMELFLTVYGRLPRDKVFGPAFLGHCKILAKDSLGFSCKTSKSCPADRRPGLACPSWAGLGAGRKNRRERVLRPLQADGFHWHHPAATGPSVGGHGIASTRIIDKGVGLR